VGVRLRDTLTPGSTCVSRAGERVLHDRELYL